MSKANYLISLFKSFEYNFKKMLKNTSKIRTKNCLKYYKSQNVYLNLSKLARDTEIFLRYFLSYKN